MSSCSFHQRDKEIEEEEEEEGEEAEDQQELAEDVEDEGDDSSEEEEEEDDEEEEEEMSSNPVSEQAKAAPWPTGQEPRRRGRPAGTRNMEHSSAAKNERKRQRSSHEQEQMQKEIQVWKQFVCLFDSQS